MKKTIFTLILLTTLTTFSQKQNFSVGDTLFYSKGLLANKNCATYFAIIKEKNIRDSEFIYRMEGHKRSKDSTIFFLNSKYQTRYPEVISAIGKQTFYHKNGIKSSEGERTSKAKPIGKWTHWYDSGNIREERTFHYNKALSKKKYKGYTIDNFWDRNGKQTITNGNGSYEFKKDSILRKGFYKNGKRHGKWIGYNNDRKLYEEYYKDGKIKEGKSWDKTGKIYKYKQAFIQPRYKKGQESIRKHLIKNFNIPKYAYENNISGRILLSFTVEKNGSLSNIEVARSVCKPADNEAIRVLKLMKKWKPGVSRGQKVKSKFTLPISYKL